MLKQPPAEGKIQAPLQACWPLFLFKSRAAVALTTGRFSRRAPYFQLFPFDPVLIVLVLFSESPREAWTLTIGLLLLFLGPTYAVTTSN